MPPSAANAGPAGPAAQHGGQRSRAARARRTLRPSRSERDDRVDVDRVVDWSPARRRSARCRPSGASTSTASLCAAPSDSIVLRYALRAPGTSTSSCATSAPPALSSTVRSLSSMRVEAVADAGWTVSDDGGVGAPAPAVLEADLGDALAEIARGRLPARRVDERDAVAAVGRVAVRARRPPLEVGAAAAGSASVASSAAAGAARNGNGRAHAGQRAPGARPREARDSTWLPGGSYSDPGPLRRRRRTSTASSRERGSGPPSRDPGHPASDCDVDPNYWGRRDNDRPNRSRARDLSDAAALDARRSAPSAREEGPDPPPREQSRAADAERGDGRSAALVRVAVTRHRRRRPLPASASGPGSGSSSAGSPSTSSSSSTGSSRRRGSASDVGR